MAEEGDKDDRMDVKKLADLYRGGHIRRVYHSDAQDRAFFKHLVSIYRRETGSSASFCFCLQPKDGLGKAFRRRYPELANRDHLKTCVSGRLSDLDRKSAEPIADAAGVLPRTLQELPGMPRWDEKRDENGDLGLSRGRQSAQAAS